MRRINVEGINLKIYRYPTLDDREHLRWKLKLKNGKLLGIFSAQHESPTQWMYDQLLDFMMAEVE